MLAKFRPRSVYDVMAALSLFLVIAGGSAYAANTVFSTDIVDGQVKSPDLAGAAVTNSKLGNNSVGTGKVADNSLAAADLAPGSVGASEVADNSLTGTDVLDNALTGADIAESSLGQVPVATLGGLGRSAASTNAVPCDPDSSGAYVRCVQVQLNLSSPARVLLNGRVTAEAALRTTGSCRWGGVQESGSVDVLVERNATRKYPWSASPTSCLRDRGGRSRLSAGRLSSVTASRTGTLG